VTYKRKRSNGPKKKGGAEWDGKKKIGLLEGQARRKVERRSNCNMGSEKV